ncbi:MAG: carbonic anhydrase [bacterium]
MTGAAALKLLKEGNSRFVSGKLRHAHLASDWRTHLTQGQQPIATILSCSDSRVPPELVFDQGLGDLFIVRVAGNIIDSDVLGSISYALIHLKTPLVVVMGHEKCGAVKAAMDIADGADHEMRYIEGLIDRIIPAISSVKHNQPHEDRWLASVEANVRAATIQLNHTVESLKSLRSLPVLIKKAMYKLESGVVEFLDEPESESDFSSIA